MPTKLCHLSVQLVLVDGELLRLCVNAALALLVDLLLLQERLLVGGQALSQQRLLLPDRLRQVDRRVLQV